MIASAVDDQGHAAEGPTTHILSANWPNPFNPGTSISYTLSETAEIELAIYDVRGARVATLARGSQPAGGYTVSWDGRYESGVQAPSGTYFYRLTASGSSGTVTDRGKMTLVR